MKLVHVIGGFGFGGTERLCLNLITAMPAEMHHTVIGLDASRTGIEGTLDAFPNVDVVAGRSPLAGRLQFLVWMVRQLRNIRPDGVIVHIFGVGHVLTAAAARLTGVKAIAVAAGNPAPETSGRDKWKILIVLSRLWRVPIMSYSQWVERSLLNLGTGLPRGSAVIYNGIDVARVAAEAERARAARNDNEYVVGMVSRLDAIKDQATLIRAFARLPATHEGRRVILRLVGDGQLRDELEKLASEESVADRVEFVGSRDDIPQLLGHFDIYAFSTTRDEGFGIALIEAMAAGLPIVATDVGPCRELVGDGDAAILVPPRDFKALAETLRTLLADAGRRAALAERAECRVRAEFDIRVSAGRWVEALDAQS